MLTDYNQAAPSPDAQKAAEQTLRKASPEEMAGAELVGAAREFRNRARRLLAVADVAEAASIEVSTGRIGPAILSILKNVELV